jgi:integrase/recombinase XerD
MPHLKSIVKSRSYRLLVRLLFHLGCRISEALASTVEDIDFIHNTFTIQHFKTRLNLSCPKCGARLGKMHSFCPKCGSEVTDAIAKELEHRRVRTLPIDRGTLNILKDFIKRGGQSPGMERKFSSISTAIGLGK